MNATTWTYTLLSSVKSVDGDTCVQVVVNNSDDV